VVFLYLLPDLNVQLIPQLEKLRPGTRIVSHEFDMKGVRPDIVLTVVSKEDDDEHQVYMWTTPLRHEPPDDPAADATGVPRLEEPEPPLPWEQERGTRKVSRVGKP